MISELRQDKIWRAFNAFRGYTPTDRYMESAFLLNKTKKTILEKGVEATQEECYETMLTVADEHEISNPFSNAEEFYKVYMATDDEIDWELVLLADDDKAMSGRFYIPEVLLRRFESAITDDMHTILIPEAEKFAVSIKDVIEGHPDKVYTLTTMNAVAKAVLEEIFAGFNNVRILQTSIYLYEFTDMKFDYIMAVPVFGVRDRAEDSEFICKEY